MKLVVFLLYGVKLCDCLLIDLQTSLQLSLQFLIFLGNLSKTFGLFVNNLLHLFNVRFTKNQILQLLIVLIILDQVFNHSFSHLSVNFFLQILKEIFLKTNGLWSVFLRFLSLHLLWLVLSRLLLHHSGAATCHWSLFFWNWWLLVKLLLNQFDNVD